MARADGRFEELFSSPRSEPIRIQNLCNRGAVGRLDPCKNASLAVRVGPLSPAIPAAAGRRGRKPGHPCKKPWRNPSHGASLASPVIAMAAGRRARPTKSHGISRRRIFSRQISPAATDGRCSSRRLAAATTPSRCSTWLRRLVLRGAARQRNERSSASKAVDPARAALSIPPMKAIAKSRRAEARMVIFLRHRHSEALARVRAYSGRLEVRWPFAFRRSLTPRPAPCGGSRGRGSHARRALRAGGGRGIPYPHRPPTFKPLVRIRKRGPTA
jgi:hypothetical protein